MTLDRERGRTYGVESDVGGYQREAAAIFGIALRGPLPPDPYARYALNVPKRKPARPSRPVLVQRQNGTRAAVIPIIINAVSVHYGMSPDGLTGQSRCREVTQARHVAMYLLRALGLHTTQIGRAFGGRDRSTVIAGCRRVAVEHHRDTGMQLDIETIVESLKARPAGEREKGK